MTLKLQSTNSDQILLGVDSQGVMIGVIPSNPPKNDALDVFHALIRFTNVVRAIGVLDSGGIFTTDDGKSRVVGENGSSRLSFEFSHAPGDWFDVPLSVAVTDQFRTYLRQSLEGKVASVSDDQQFGAAIRPGVKVGRNDKCPCGSGKKYKKCCIGKDLSTWQLPDELAALAEVGNAETAALLNYFYEDPRVIEDAEYWSALGVNAGINDHPEMALQCFQRAHSINPGDGGISLNLAVHLARAGRADESIDLISKVSDGTYRKSAIFANVLQEEGHHAEAIPLYEAAIREEPDFYLPYARILTSLKATESPLYDLWLERGLEAHPESPWLALYFVQRCLKQNRFQELADAEWIEQLAVSPDDQGVVGVRGEDAKNIIECQLTRFAACLLLDPNSEQLQSVLDILKNIPEEWHFCDIGKIIASLAARIGSVEGVQLAFQRICQTCLDEKNGIESDINGYLAVACASNADHHAAKEYCEKCLANDPENTLGLWQHWWVLDELEQTDDAITEAEKLLELHTELPRLNYNLGYMCGKVGAFGKTIFYYEQELKVDPKCFVAWENLCFVQLLSHKPDAARKSFQTYTRLFREHIALNSDDTGAVAVMNDVGYDWSPSDDYGEIQLVTLDQFMDAKTAKFEALVSLATTTKGSSRFAIDLVQANEASTPIIGSSTTIRPEFLTPDRILEGISGTAAAVEEMKFQLEAQKSGDASTAYASVAQEITWWRDLPPDAMLSLVEAERVFQTRTSVDSAPYIVAYAKAIEIYLHESVFQSFRKQLIASHVSERLTRDILTQGRSNKAFALARFIEAGSALTLGSMNFFLPLCNGRSAERIPLIGSLRSHITDDLSIPELLDDSTISGLRQLSDNFRNKAAHEKPFDGLQCAETRDLVITLLRRLKISNREVLDHVPE